MLLTVLRQATYVIGVVKTEATYVFDVVMIQATYSTDGAIKTEVVCMSDVAQINPIHLSVYVKRTRSPGLITYPTYT